MLRAKGRKATLTWLLVGLFALAFLGSTVFSRPFQSQAGSHGPDNRESDLAMPPSSLPGKRTTFLIMGVDARSGDYGRTDSMIVASYDSASDQLSAVSIARDTWVQIPGRGYDKINHSYAFGGPELAVQTVQRALNIPIDHYVTLSFSGFEKMINAMGGVEIEAEKRLYYHDPDDLDMGPDGLIIDIWPGVQQMDGPTLLSYSRFRADEEGDLGRIRRQQQVIGALIRTVARPALLVTIPQLIPALYETVETDMSVAQMLKLAAKGPDALGTPLKTGTFDGTPKMIDTIFYLIPDLVQQRATAYRILVGSEPPDPFLIRAAEDQAIYETALAAAVAASPPSTSTAVTDRDSEQNANRSDGEAARESADFSRVSETREPAAKEQPADQNQRDSEGQESFTVAVVDATGQQMGPEYAAILRAAGFQVVRVSRSSRVVHRTVVLNRFAPPAVIEVVQSLLPNALMVGGSDPAAATGLEIVLGADLLPKRMD